VIRQAQGRPLATATVLRHHPLMTGHPVSLNGIGLEARSSGALWWPERRLLCVSDLHLGKSERLARRGGSLLPPYETTETLARLADEISRLAPDTVVCLGDSFDDPLCLQGLDAREEERLTALMAGRDWIWIAGNHDPGSVAPGGTHLPELGTGNLTFRHQAAAGAGPGEISGHYHPKIRLPIRGGGLVRSCFLADRNRMILPAFGAYTGGLWWDAPPLDGLFGEDGRAILTGTPCLCVPMQLTRARRRARSGAFHRETESTN
jgi:uncharacterized protein